MEQVEGVLKRCEYGFRVWGWCRLQEAGDVVDRPFEGDGGGKLVVQPTHAFPGLEQGADKGCGLTHLHLVFCALRGAGGMGEYCRSCAVYGQL